MVVVGGGEGFCVLGIFVAWDHCGVCFPRDPDRLNDNCNVNGLVWFGLVWVWCRDKGGREKKRVERVGGVENIKGFVAPSHTLTWLAWWMPVEQVK